MNADDQQRKKDLEYVHPTYSEQHENWQLLLDALNASGGFSTGAYLWKFPNEFTDATAKIDEFAERKSQARYHNIVEALVELYVRHLFQEGVTRDTTNEALKAWWQDVDGTGATTIDDFVRRAIEMALAAGHVGALVDRTADAPANQTKAGERSRVIATLFPPTSILDWRRAAGGTLVAVKLRERADGSDILERAYPEDMSQYLLWTRDGWQRFASDGTAVEGDTGKGTADLGVVPFAYLIPKPNTVDPLSVGRPLVGHAGLVRALYNRCSEEDHVLRGQAFSLLAAEAPADASGEDILNAQGTISASFGVQRVAVLKGKLYYVTPDMSAPAQVQKNIEFLIREMYRAAHVPFETDSREAESAEARALKHKELNQMLQGTAAACQAFELAMVRHWFAWTTPTAAAAEAAFAAADVQIRYPREFFPLSLSDDLDAWGLSMTAVNSPTYRRHMEKRIVRRVDPELVQRLDVLATIDREIDTSEKPLTPAEEARALRASASARLAPKAEGAA